MQLSVKDRFRTPRGLIYLDGDSQGSLPKGVRSAGSNMIGNQWSAHRIKGSNADHWMEQPIRVGDRIATVLGAPDRTIALGDTLSIRIYQLLAAGPSMRRGLTVVLSDTGRHPSDLHGLKD